MSKRAETLDKLVEKATKQKNAADITLLAEKFEQGAIETLEKSGVREGHDVVVVDGMECEVGLRMVDRVVVDYKDGKVAILDENDPEANKILAELKKSGKSVYYGEYYPDEGSNGHASHYTATVHRELEVKRDGVVLEGKEKAEFICKANKLGPYAESEFTQVVKESGRSVKQEAKKMAAEKAKKIPGEGIKEGTGLLSRIVGTVMRNVSQMQRFGI